MIEFAQFQLGGLGDGIGQFLYFGLFFVMIFFYPRIMMMQIVYNLERTANLLESYSVKGKNIVLKKISNNPTAEQKEAVANFLNFFMIEPISLDPYGIVKKLEHISNQQEEKFKYFISRIAPKYDSETQAYLVMGMSGAVSLNQIAKIVRHFVELIKKTKNLQLAMLLQMQLPMIEKISKALLKGTEALSNGWTIGDSIGPYVASRMIGDTKIQSIDEETITAKKKVKGKDVIFVRARGPGGRLGKLGIDVERLIKQNKISKIITIDAAAKLEGEKTGSTAEGIGVAIGGIGIDRAYIEAITTEKKIPLDSFVIKMAQEEAIMPMRMEILNATDSIISKVEQNLAETKGRGKIIIVGVGNCNGIGNDKKAIAESEIQIKKIAKIVKQKEEEEKKRKSKWKFFGG